MLWRGRLDSPRCRGYPELRPRAGRTPGWRWGARPFSIRSRREGAGVLPGPSRSMNAALGCRLGSSRRAAFCPESREDGQVWRVRLSSEERVRVYPTAPSCRSAPEHSSGRCLAMARQVMARCGNAIFAIDAIHVARHLAPRSRSAGYTRTYCMLRRACAT